MCTAENSFGRKNNFPSLRSIRNNYFFSKEIVLLTAKRPTLCVKRNPSSAVLTAVNTNAG